jgi:hypothetical protein
MGLRFEVRETHRRVDTEFFSAMDEFVVRIVEAPVHAVE